MMPMVDVLFELHPNFNDLRPELLPWAIEHQPKIYMPEKHPELQNSVAYPREEITERFGPYFTSTIAYMVALAITEEPEFIGVYGVDMATAGEYYDQRPCCEFLLGIAAGMGIEIGIPKSSALLKSPWIYGFDNSHAKTPKNRELDELANWKALCLMLRDRWAPDFNAEALVAKSNGGLAYRVRTE